MRQDSGDERRRVTLAYCEGLGLAAVAAVRGADGMRIIALAAGGNDGVNTVGEPVVRLWCKREAEATFIAAAAAKVLRRKPDDDAGEVIQAAAKRLGVIVQTDGELAAEAAAVAERVALEMRRRQQSGELKAINQAYRSYRLEADSRGERALRYDAWIRRYREDLVRQVAATLRQI